MDKVLKTIAALMLTMVFVVGCNKPDNPGNGGNDVQNDSIVDNGGSHNGHDYIDLGLPSGIMWAACNLGASCPEEIGDYIAWGETAPKELYDWKSYRYGVFAGDHYDMTKYCTQAIWVQNEYIDNLILLEPNDDAAMINWGAGWRMPTREDWDELCRETTCTLTKQNGVIGRLMTGKNGNSIFLPATGFRLDDELFCPNLGVYWSSSLYTGSPDRAWSFHYDNDEYHVCGTYERNRGQAVRAVCTMR